MAPRWRNRAPTRHSQKEAPADALGHLYTGPTLYGPAAQGLTALLGLLDGGGQANLSLVPTASSGDVDVDTPLRRPLRAARGGLLFSGGEATKALGELPADPGLGWV